MSWRPENWPEIRLKATIALLKSIKPKRKPTGEQWIEAGADTILEALKAKGTLIKESEYSVNDIQYLGFLRMIGAPVGCNFYTVFIPGEAE